MHLAAVKTEQMQEKTWKTSAKSSYFGDSAKSDGFCLSPGPNAARIPDSSAAFWALSIFSKPMCTLERCLRDTCRGPPDRENKVSFEKTEDFLVGMEEAAD